MISTYPDLLGIGPNCGAATARVLPSVESEKVPPNRSIWAFPFLDCPFCLKNGVIVGLRLGCEDGRKLGREDEVGLRLGKADEVGPKDEPSLLVDFLGRVAIQWPMLQLQLQIHTK